MIHLLNGRTENHQSKPAQTKSRTKTRERMKANGCGLLEVGLGFDVIVGGRAFIRNWLLDRMR